MTLTPSRLTASAGEAIGHTIVNSSHCIRCARRTFPCLDTVRLVCEGRSPRAWPVFRQFVIEYCFKRSRTIGMPLLSAQSLLWHITSGRFRAATYVDSPSDVPHASGLRLGPTESAEAHARPRVTLTASPTTVPSELKTKLVVTVRNGVAGQKVAIQRRLNTKSRWTTLQTLRLPKSLTVQALQSPKLGTNYYRAHLARKGFEPCFRLEAGQDHRHGAW